MNGFSYYCAFCKNKDLGVLCKYCKTRISLDGPLYLEQPTHFQCGIGIEFFKTNQLVDELKRREGVETHEIGPNAHVNVETDGPAIVLVVID